MLGCKNPAFAGHVDRESVQSPAVHLRNVTGTVSAVNSALAMETKPAFAGQVEKKSKTTCKIQVSVNCLVNSGVANSTPELDGTKKPAFAGQVERDSLH